MANKLKDMEFNSVDLCKRGANQKAFIRLLKSADPGEGGDDKVYMSTIAKLAAAIKEALAGEDIEAPITKAAGTEQVRATTEALRKSLESIIADDSLSAVEKHDMMADSLQQFTLEATELMDGWSEAVWKAEDDPEEDPEDEYQEEDEPGEEPEDEPEDEPEEDTEPGEEPEEDETVEKGVFDMATIDINKMSPEDKATLDALAKKYGAEEEPKGQEIHPDVQKAIDEVAEMRKSLEIKELEGIAKKYEVIGKKAEELAPKLYELKKAGEQHYNDFVALLDEQVQMASSSIFKEIGTSRGGTPTDLDATVAELMKADSNLSRAQAIVKAFEINPALDPFTGKAK